jgi:hypothetical protein
MMATLLCSEAVGTSTGPEDMIAVGDDEVATPFSLGIKYTETQLQLQHSEIGSDSRMFRPDSTKLR